MKTLKLKIVAGLTAIILLFGAFIVVKAMEKKVEQPAAVDPMTVYFQPQSNDPSAIQNTSNWGTSPGTLECEGSSYLCEVTFDRNTYSNLSAFLAANPNKAAIESNALSVSHKD